MNLKQYKKSDKTILTFIYFTVVNVFVIRFEIMFTVIHKYYYDGIHTE